MEGSVTFFGSSHWNSLSFGYVWEGITAGWIFETPCGAAALVMSISVSQKPFLSSKNRYFLILRCMHTIKVWQSVDFRSNFSQPSHHRLTILRPVLELSRADLNDAVVRLQIRELYFFDHFSTGSAINLVLECRSFVTHKSPCKSKSFRGPETSLLHICIHVLPL